jgi:hypothetical protein
MDFEGLNVINLTDREKTAISNIDERDLETLIDQALQDERATGFHQLFHPLGSSQSLSQPRNVIEKDPKLCVPEEIYRLPFHR